MKYEVGIMRAWPLFGEAEATLLAISNDEDTMVVTSQMLGARSWFMSLLGSVQQSQEMAKRSLATLRQLNRRQEQLIPLEGLAMSDYLSKPDFRGHTGCPKRAWTSPESWTIHGGRQRL